MNTTEFSAIVKTEVQLIDLINSLDPFQSNLELEIIDEDMKLEVEYSPLTQTEWIRNGEV